MIDAIWYNCPRCGRQLMKGSRCYFCEEADRLRTEQIIRETQIKSELSNRESIKVSGGGCLMIFGWVIIAFGIIGFVVNLTKHPEKVGNSIVALLFLLIVGGGVVALGNLLKKRRRK